MRKLYLVIAIVCASILGCAGTYGVGVQYAVSTRPPPPLVEIVPPAPSPGYAWMDGYWHWNGFDYAWRPGRWIVPPSPGLYWYPGGWIIARRGYHYAPGRWVRTPPPPVVRRYVYPHRPPLRYGRRYRALPPAPPPAIRLR